MEITVDVRRIWVPPSKRGIAEFEIAKGSRRVHREAGVYCVPVRGKRCWFEYAKSRKRCCKPSSNDDYRYCDRHLSHFLKLRISDTSDHLSKLTPPVLGKGLYATGFIRKGCIIDVYGGEKMTPREIDARYDGTETNNAPYSLVDSRSTSGIDGFCAPTAACFANDPKGVDGVKPNAASEYDEGTDVFALRALRDIKPGEEILMDYGAEYWS